ncbi:hypothetical protein GK047_12645 [Paenibacillus sp. SYP-B3998]|uniref:Uncharacterized protein n=2 Tax=Paenibacillus sp. SYP-B3998 TaxID=2678564 RepID=A0A6G3ZYT4_9BACL|nr:hypothetical protein [Paenibacillus sp. SYP-B3998]
MSFILERTKQMPFHTDMRRVFNVFDGKQKDYNWLITDLVYYVGARRSAANELLPDDLEFEDSENYPTDLLDKYIILIDGEELTKIIYGNDIQFVWGVFSGIPKNIEIDTDELEVMPYADGNPKFWIADPTIQHPMADIEVVCWDSTLTLLFSKDEVIGKNFQEYFKDSIDLKDYNKKFFK